MATTDGGETFITTRKIKTGEELTARAEASNRAIEEGKVSDIESILNEKW